MDKSSIAVVGNTQGRETIIGGKMIDGIVVCADTNHGVEVKDCKHSFGVYVGSAAHLVFVMWLRPLALGMFWRKLLPTAGSLALHIGNTQADPAGTIKKSTN